VTVAAPVRDGVQTLARGERRCVHRPARAPRWTGCRAVTRPASRSCPAATTAGTCSTTPA